MKTKIVAEISIKPSKRLLFLLAKADIIQNKIYIKNFGAAVTNIRNACLNYIKKIPGEWVNMIKQNMYFLLNAYSEFSDSDLALVYSPLLDIRKKLYQFEILANLIIENPDNLENYEALKKLVLEIGIVDHNFRTYCRTIERTIQRLSGNSDYGLVVTDKRTGQIFDL